jgi:hypothetical protein
MRLARHNRRLLIIRPVVAARRAPDSLGRAQRLRVDDRGRGFEVPACLLTAGPAQPVVHDRQQPLALPAAEEPVAVVPGGEVREHRTPLDAVVRQIQHRVDQLAVAVLLGTAAVSEYPRRVGISGRRCAHSVSVRSVGYVCARSGWSSVCPKRCATRLQADEV